MKRFVVWGFGLLALAGPPIAVFQSNGLAALAVLGAVVVLLGLFGRGQGAAFWRQPLTILITLLLLWMVLTGFWSLSPADTYSTLQGLAPAMLAGAALVAGARVLQPGEVQSLARLLLFSYALLIGLLGLELLTGGFLLGAYHGLKQVPFTFAVTMLSRGVVLAILLSWATAILLLRQQRTWLAAAAVIAAVAIAFGSGSYAGRMAAIVGVLVFGFVLLLRHRGLIIVLAALLAFSATIPLLPQGPLDPEANAAWLGPFRNSGLHRLYIWRFAAERVAEHPLRGWGLDAARSMPGGEAPSPVGGQLMMMHPHNGPLQVWLELGLPGILALLILLVLIGRGILTRAAHQPTQAALGAVLVAGFAVLCLGFGIWQTWWVGAMGMTAGWLVLACRVPIGGRSQS